MASFGEFQHQFSESVLGQIPKEKTKGKLTLLQPDDARHIFAESYRNVRSSIFFMPYEGPRPKTLLVTSAVPNEGKSTIAANLAITMALSGARTLLIDADLRYGRQFNVPGIILNFVDTSLPEYYYYQYAEYYNPPASVTDDEALTAPPPREPAKQPS